MTSNTFPLPEDPLKPGRVSVTSRLRACFASAWEHASVDQRKAWLVQRGLRPALTDSLARDGFLEASFDQHAVSFDIPDEDARKLLLAYFAEEIHPQYSDPAARLAHVTRYTWDRIGSLNRPFVLEALGVPPTLAESLHADGTLSHGAPDAPRGLTRRGSHRGAPRAAVGESPTGPRFAIDWFDEDTLQVAAYRGEEYRGSQLFSFDERRVRRDGDPFWDQDKILSPRPPLSPAERNDLELLFDHLRDESVRDLHRFALIDEHRLVGVIAAQRHANRTVRPPEATPRNSIRLNSLGIRPETLDAPQFRGAWSETTDAKKHVVFPLTRWPPTPVVASIRDDARPGLVGYELVSHEDRPPARGLSGFWESTATANAFQRLIIVQNAVDALAYHQLMPDARNRYLSVGGTFDSAQARLFAEGAPFTAEGPRAPSEVEVVVAFARDRHGSQLARALADALPKGLRVEDLRTDAPTRGSWLDQVRTRERDFIRNVTRENPTLLPSHGRAL